MRDRDRTTGGDLVGEEGHHAGWRTDDVDEADGGCEFGMSEHGQLRDTLGGAHNAVRSDTFVGGDQDHLPGAMFGGASRQPPGADAVDGDRRKRIALHQRDVLQSGSVNDHLRAVLVEERSEESAVADAAEDRDAAITIAACGHLGGNREQRLFGNLEKDDDPGAGSGQDASHLRADEAARAGDEDALAGDAWNEGRAGSRGFAAENCGPGSHGCAPRRVGKIGLHLQKL